MTTTFKTLLMGSAMVLTLGATGAMAENADMSAGGSASIQTESNMNSADYPTPASPDANVEAKSNIGGQEDEYAPTERNERADSLGTSNDGVQMDTEMDAAASADVNSDEVAKNVQEKLNEEGYRVSVDGVIGNETRNALKSFQASNNLSATGEINTQTLAALNISNN